MMLKRFRLSFFVAIALIFVSGCTLPDKVVDIDDYVNNTVVSTDGSGTISFTRLSANDLAGVDERGYYYSCLSETEQLVYGELYLIFRDRITDTEVSTKDAELVKRVAEAVLLDHPELFYVESYNLSLYTVGGEYVHIVPQGIYNCDTEQEKLLKQQVDEYVERVIQTIYESDSDYEKTKKVYEYIILNTDYVLGAPNNQNLISVMVGGQSVCNGYSKAFMYIMQRLGIECFIVDGYGDGDMLHAWNIVKLDGSYYHVDVTWGDTSFDDSGEMAEYSKSLEICYDYLAVPDEWLFINHRISNNYDFVIPKCVSLNQNYYVQEKLFMEKFTPDNVQVFFDRARASESDYVLMKFSDRAEYEKCYEYLITDSGIWNHVGKFKSGVTYYTSDGAMLFVILLK